MAIELVRKLPYDHPYRWDGTAVGGVKLWRPDELGADLALWLDAEDTSTITLNGSNVTQWDDKSGNGNHVANATAATQPDYLATGWNGQPTVSFTRLGLEFLFKQNVLNFSASGDFTIASAFEFFEPANRWDMIAGWRSTANASGGAGGVPILQGMSTSQEIGYHNTDQTDTRIKVNVTTRLGKKLATISRSGGINGNNGAATVTSTGYSQATYDTNATQTFSSQAATGFQIGGRQQSATDYGDKYISEVVGCNTKLSTEDRQKLEGYLAHKWGLTANLPVDHPYKTTPPVASVDSDAQAYITAVETADGQALEVSVKTAINNFVVGCKSDGIWDAIKSSAILAGARTLSGALQPLVGSAPTNFNFVSGDYDRKTGLKGNGSNKYLDSNRNNNADPRNSKHLAIYQSSLATSDSFLLATTNTTGRSALISFTPGGISSRINSGTNTAKNGNAIGFVGGVRTSSTATSARVGGTDFPETVNSEAPLNQSLGVFATSDGQVPTDARLSFYSIGEALDLALLDTRVSNLMTAIGAAIP